MAGPVVPVWPEGLQTEPRKMLFCRGEPRWYLWVKTSDQQALLSLRRDLLLLLENNDLKQLKSGSLPPVGVYITALDRGKMIRGRVMSAVTRTDNSQQSIQVLDVDEGTTCLIPTSQVRQLPNSMMTLPAQAVRCDLGLDCQEQFKWPPELNDMIQRGLGNAILYVSNTAVRPGSIPTISADVTVFFPSLGKTVDLKQWLREDFSHHLKICGMDLYNPFPVGMAPQPQPTIPSSDQHMMGNQFTSTLPFDKQMEMMQLLQQHFLGLNIQPSLPYCITGQLPPCPPGFTVPVYDPYLVFGDSLSSPPSISSSLYQDSLNAFIQQQSSSESYAGSLYSEPSNCSSSTALDLSIHSDSGESGGLDVINIPATPKPISSNPTPSRTSPSRITTPSPLRPAPITSPNKECHPHQQITIAKSPSRESEPIASSSTSKKALQKASEIALQEFPFKWLPGVIVPAVVASCYDPKAFEVNVVNEDNCTSFQEIKDEMSHFYKSCHIRLDTKVQAKSVCGEYCAFYNEEEKCWCRAEVLDWNLAEPSSPVLVWQVDEGGTSSINLNSIQPLNSLLARSTPRLAIMCSMQNICPKNRHVGWSEAHLQRFKQLMPLESLVYLRIDGIKDSGYWPVSVFTDQNCSLDSINEKLVAEGCAAYVGYPDNAENTQSAYCAMDDNPMEEAYKIGGNNYDLDDEDACVAVSGRRPKDEEGICWAYQRAGGFCYKKYCTQKHVLLDPDGVSMDKEEVHTVPLIDLHIPERGSSIRLSVSRILKVNHFIAQIKLGRSKTGLRAKETLASLLQLLNTKETKRTLKAFTTLPAPGEIILARDCKGIFFRGRILDADIEDDDVYQVFNVDDGHLSWVQLEDLRIMDPAFLHHPFQAVECLLFNYELVNEEKDWIKTCNSVFADIVKGKTLSAKVVTSSPMYLEVELFDVDGRNIGESLVEEGILRVSSRAHAPSVESVVLPG